MRTAVEIRHEARGALRANSGWRSTIGGWGLWLGIEYVLSAFLGVPTNPAMLIMAAASPGALSGMMLAVLVLMAFAYYIFFVKVYGTTALALSVVRGVPSVRYAFSGFRVGWRAVGVHFRIGWRILLPAAPGLLLLMSLLSWFSFQGPEAVEVVRHHAVLFSLGGLLMLLLAIPAVMVWYNYRMAYNVLVDHADWSGGAVVDEARRLMAGHRAVLFRVDLWFIVLSIAFFLPGTYLVFQSAMNADVANLLHEVITRQGDQAAMVSALQTLPALRDLALGVFLLFAATIASLFWLKPLWATAHAAFYENLLDEDDARRATEEPSDGRVADGVVSENRSSGNSLPAEDRASTGDETEDQ